MTHQATRARQILVSTQAHYQEALEGAERARFVARQAEDQIKAAEAALEKAKNLASHADTVRREANRKVESALHAYKTAEIAYNKERAVKEAEEAAQKAAAAITAPKRSRKVGPRTMVHRKSR